MSKHGLSQGSVLGSLLFLLFIKDLHEAIINSSIHHFAADTNLLLAEKSLSKINKRLKQWPQSSLSIDSK